MTAVSFGLVIVMGSPILGTDRLAGSIDDNSGRRIEAKLTGFDENPTLSTTGHGTFRALITKEGTVFYELKYADLEADITQSHIHFGKPAINGGIAVWLCGTPANPGPATNLPPSCELGRSGTVTGSFDAGDVVGPAGQGIAPGEFEEFLEAIGAGATYANVHTTLRPAGEIRGLVK
jgi:hypothetical protein